MRVVLLFVSSLDLYCSTISLVPICGSVNAAYNSILLDKEFGTVRQRYFSLFLELKFDTVDCVRVKLFDVSVLSKQTQCLIYHYMPCSTWYIETAIF